MNRDDPYLLDTHGWALALAEKYTESLNVLILAERGFAKTTAADATHQELYAHLGYVYRKLGQRDQAEEALTKAKTYKVEGKWAEFIEKEITLLEGNTEN